MANYLQYSAAEVVAQLLVDLGLATYNAAWPVFVANEPGVPDEVLTVYDTAASDDGRTMPAGELEGQFGWQIRARSRTHRAGWAKMDSIQRTFAESVYGRAVVIDGVTFVVHSLSRIGSVLPIGPESATSVRLIFTMNGFIAVEQT